MAHIQVRNVPPDVHARLKRRAADEGVSLSEYLLGEILELAQRPTLAELSERIRGRARVRPRRPVADVLREERQTRERRLAGR